ncbi:hypothetical protein [Burkholderia diffusa]|uniref:hypothetical protein n=1 Tax=Burkholderia diffusa TaxID=488732 RepID=UPI0012D8970C|nr:hypothetical protein [Burkholderia diffusa]
MSSQLLSSSDKSFWHGYLGFYEQHLPKTVAGSILEFGVFKGNSIRWLLQTFPNAKIVGADILQIQPEWPTHENVEYRQVDQADEQAVSALVRGIDDLELIIEDGSHFPSHQSICLKHGIDALLPGGTYVLEDVHTSHPAHDQYRQEFGDQLGQTSLSVLLGLEHVRRLGEMPSEDQFLALAAGTHFSLDDVRRLHAQIETISFYRRATLPTSCWRCGSTSFNYHALKCECGVDLLSEADSMTIVIKKRLV